MRLLFIPWPLSYAVCVFTRVSTSVYGLCLLLRFMDNASTLYVLLSCNNLINLMCTSTCNQLDKNKSHAIHGLNTILHNMYDNATYDMNLCGCDLMSPCSFNISANARFEELCLFGILIQACGGREGSSLTSFAMPIWFWMRQRGSLRQRGQIAYNSPLTFEVHSQFLQFSSFTCFGLGFVTAFAFICWLLAPYMDEWVLGHNSRGYFA